MVTRKPRTAFLGVGVLAAVLLAAGCQPRVGTAALVGDNRITTSTLNDATAQAAPDPTPSPGTTVESTVLTSLIQHQLLVDLAASRSVPVLQGDIDAAYANLTAQAATASASPSSEALRRSAFDVAAIQALENDYVAKGHTADSAAIVAFPVTDQATAELALAALQASPGDGAAIAKKFSADPTAITQGQVPLTQLPPAVAALQPQKSAIATISGAIYVIEVTAKQDVADLQKDLATIADVTVNPRFGAWDPRSIQVGPTHSDVVLTVPSSGATPAPAPSGDTPSDAVPSAAPAS